MQRARVRSRRNVTQQVKMCLTYACKKHHYKREVADGLLDLPESAVPPYLILFYLLIITIYQSQV